METLLLLLTTVLGSRMPASVRGHVAELTVRQQLDLLYLIRAGREVEAVQQVRCWKAVPLADAVATVRHLKMAGSVSDY